MFLRFIPKNHLSFIIGKLAGLRCPWLSKLAVRCFVRRYKVDTTQLMKPLDYYQSLADFFVREVAPELRPVGAGLVSPVDGTLRGYGVIEDGLLEQIKGKSYSVLSLLRDEEKALRFAGGYYFNFYLAPDDYHHIHAPIGGAITGVSYIPGKLWPVNDWSISRVADLFSVNERMIVYIDTPAGVVAVVMVGATNVGKITLEFDKALCANRFERILFGTKTASLEKRYAQPIPIKSGGKLGTFHLGSSVVVLCEKGRISIVKNITDTAYAKIKYGMSVGEVAV